MKTFEDYKNGEWVVFFNEDHSWHLMQFQAYKSMWTHDAFRLKYGDREVIADISEIRPISELNQLMKERDENLNRDFQRSTESIGYDEDSVYHIQD